MEIGRPERVKLFQTKKNLLTGRPNPKILVGRAGALGYTRLLFGFLSSRVFFRPRFLSHLYKDRSDDPREAPGVEPDGFAEGRDGCQACRAEE